MPLAAEVNGPVVGVEVEVSAAVDLYVFISNCGNGKCGPKALRPDPELAERLADFWGEGPTEYGSFDELLVLAATGDLLVGGDSPDPLLDALPQLAARPAARLRLRTEQEDTKERVIRHLDALREDADLRERYVGMVREAAAQLRERRREQLPSLLARADWYRARLAEGDDIESLAPPRHLALLPRYRGLLDEALRNGRVLLVPVLESDVLYDLPGVLLVGIRLHADSPAEEARRRTAKIAERLRALGDPTRLAMAAYLSSNPASVSALARAFDLSQPTVSAHIRSLRSAGLLDSRRSGVMTEFRLAEGRLSHLFEDAQEALFGDRS